MGHRKYLSYGHRLRHGRHDREFGQKKASRLPVRTTADFWKRRWRSVKRKEIPIKQAEVKAKSIFYKLPYYKVCISHISACITVH